MMSSAFLDDLLQSAMRTDDGHGAGDRSSECKRIGHEASWVWVLEMRARRHDHERRPTRDCFDGRGSTAKTNNHRCDERGQRRSREQLDDPRDDEHLVDTGPALRHRSARNGSAARRELRGLARFASHRGRARAARRTHRRAVGRARRLRRAHRSRDHEGHDHERHAPTHGSTVTPGLHVGSLSCAIAAKNTVSSHVDRPGHRAEVGRDRREPRAQSRGTRAPTRISEKRRAQQLR